jgi:acetyltransferase-like isoleucine patch superfamily enzyme
MRRFIIGTGQFAENIYYTMGISFRDSVHGFVVGDEYLNGKTEYLEKPLIALSQVSEKCPPSEFSPVIAFIGDALGVARSKMHFELKDMGYNFANIIHDTAIVVNSTLGTGNILFPHSMICNGSSIGSFNIFWPHTVIEHNNTIGNFNVFSHCVIGGCSIIGNHCFIGLFASVNPHVKVKDHTFIGAGANMRRDTREYGVYAPSKTIELPIDGSKINL